MVRMPTLSKRLIPNLIADLKRHAPNMSSSPRVPATFTLFFALPPEIRLLVYEHYFGDTDQRVAPKSQPQSRHGTALLFVSHEVHEEALPIFFLSATLTLDLHPRFHGDVKDYAYWLDKGALVGHAGRDLAGEVSQLQSFRHVHLTLSRPAYLLSTREAMASDGSASSRSTIRLPTTSLQRI